MIRRIEATASLDVPNANLNRTAKAMDISHFSPYVL